MDYKIIIITHKAIHGTAPNYLSSLVNFKPNSSYSLRSNNKYLLSNPNLRILPTLCSCFVAATPRLWNNLLLDLRCTSDFKVFKRTLKTHPVILTIYCYMLYTGNILLFYCKAHLKTA